RNRNVGGSFHRHCSGSVLGILMVAVRAFSESLHSAKSEISSLGKQSRLPLHVLYRQLPRLIQQWLAVDNAKSNAMYSIAAFTNERIQHLAHLLQITNGQSHHVGGHIPDELRRLLVLILVFRLQRKLRRFDMLLV